jgi:cyclopropane fatty-acyl-phospholipid synthase-like methyltransferase
MTRVSNRDVLAAQSGWRVPFEDWAQSSPMRSVRIRHSFHRVTSEGIAMDHTSSGERKDYVYDADRDEEERRLVAQARYLDPLTERVFRQAGLGSGMHVLEIGSGAGDVALLASRLVGPGGSVLGIERSPEAIALARRRITAAGIENITLVQGDLSALTAVLETYNKPFDAG